MRADIFASKTSVGVPHVAPGLERPVFSDEPHVLRQTRVVAIGNVAHLVGAGTQQLVGLVGGAMRRRRHKKTVGVGVWRCGGGGREGDRRGGGGARVLETYLHGSDTYCNIVLCTIVVVFLFCLCVKRMIPGP